jgi:hypothetical protein
MFDQSFAGLIVTFDWRNTTPQSGSRQPGLESGHKASRRIAAISQVPAWLKFEFGGEVAT